MATKKTAVKKAAKKAKTKTAKFVLVVNRSGGWVVGQDDFYPHDYDETDVILKYEIEIPTIDFSAIKEQSWHPATLVPK